MKFLRQLGQPKHTHGLTFHPLYHVWYSMMRRCYHNQHIHFKSYGGRGIIVCAEWHNITVFIQDMFPTYTDGMKLERINNNDGYTKTNCIWANDVTQGNNKRNNHIIEIEGVYNTLTNWMRILNIKKPTYQKRLKLGHTPVSALLTPINKSYQRKRKSAYLKHELEGTDA